MEERVASPETLPLACSVGIMAYNEAGNIARAIESILRQQPANAYVAEVIVIASGCTDRTVPIVAEIARKDSRVRLIVQERREGKASAINEFLRVARSPVNLMSSADVVLKDGTIEALVGHFQDPTVGMVGGRPQPVNSDQTFIGFAVHLLWDMHDQVARDQPKLGEVVAFRNVVPSIPLDTAVDEISIQALVSQLGYRLVYDPEAVIYNRGPATAGDFLRQRRRIHAGHLQIRQQQGYAASTMSVRRVTQALLSVQPFTTPRSAAWAMGTIGLEALSRGLGRYDYLRRKQHAVWQMATSTKSGIFGLSGDEGHQSVLVFRIVDYAKHETELGARAGRQLIQQVMQQLQSQLGAEANISSKNGGTIIVMLAAGREEAEPLALQLVDCIEAQPLRCGGRGEGLSVKLACGLISFSQAGEPVSLSIPAAVPANA
jgi:biofilm PGA synthesis N-glycosyltransferase PgaC